MMRAADHDPEAARRATAPPRPRPQSCPAPGSAEQVLSLQHAVGNRAVTGIVGARPVLQRMLGQDAVVDTRVMILNMKYEPIARGTIVAGPRNPGDVTALVRSKGTNKPRKLDYLRTLSSTEAANDDGTDELVKPASNYPAEAKELLTLWDLRPDDRTGSLLGAPDKRVVQLASQAHAAFASAPVTQDRTVYLQDGSFADAERLFGELLGKFAVEGSSVLANRGAQVVDAGATWILREFSSDLHRIAGTIELQVGTHSCEYKFARSAQERAAEEKRVASWDPDTPEAKKQAESNRRRFEMGQDPRGSEVSNELVGGSHGRTEQVYFASVADYAEKGYHEKYFTKEAWEHFLKVPKKLQLLFLNRNFTGARVDTQIKKKDSENLTGVTGYDLPHGYAPIDNVLAYNQQDPGETARLKTIHHQHGEMKVPGARGASADVPVLTVAMLFWENFGRLRAAEQIAVIDESVGQDEGHRASLDIAATMQYHVVKETEGAEPRSEFHISNVTFLIASAHSYKFHEQSLESHPGFAGTQKEIELAIMLHALGRYHANALPRLGAVGGISESKYFVVVNGVKIAYLAWSPAPGSGLIHISDYMAVDVPPIPVNA